jgi:hypothetical protein
MSAFKFRKRLLPDGAELAASLFRKESRLISGLKLGGEYEKEDSFSFTNAACAWRVQV